MEVQIFFWADNSRAARRGFCFKAEEGRKIVL
jgi:hypothetical protein